MSRWSLLGVSVLAVGMLAWVGRQPNAGGGAAVDDMPWEHVHEELFRTKRAPHAYVILNCKVNSGLLFGAPTHVNTATLKQAGVDRVEACYLTHHHRDTVEGCPPLLNAKVTVRAPKASAEWLHPEGVAKFWDVSVPVVVPGKPVTNRDRTFGNFNYLVLPKGEARIDCTVAEGDEWTFNDWHIQAVATPGHSRDHMAYVLRRKGDETESKEKRGPIVLCGDAFSVAGKMWTPYTTDWDHWTDAGLKPARESLEKIAKLNPSRLCPEHGPVVTQNVADGLLATITNLTDAGFLKSFERYSKDRLGNPPAYAFLAPDQVGSIGQKPWTKVSEHLYLTGNTYVLVSKTGGLLCIDPYGDKFAEQLSTLRKDHQLGPVEVVWISHAHNDHYTGLYQIEQKEKFEVWTLDVVAEAVHEPLRYCAPFLDPRATPIDRRLKHGEMVTWREYTFTPVHLPGQSYFTMGWHGRIDGKQCFFTADNFFHADQYAGTGGWCGRNRGWPDLYGQSAQLILDVQPEWILQEHGGPYEFSREDYARRVRWGTATGRALDRLSPSGRYRHDWDPGRVRFEPYLHTAAAGTTMKAAFVIENPLDRPVKYRVQARVPSVVGPWMKEITVPRQATHRETVTLDTPRDLAAPRVVQPFTVEADGAPDSVDLFFILDAPKSN